MAGRRTRLVGCLVVPRFALACELAERPELRGRPVVVAGGEGPVVWAASRAATAEGVAVGRPVREAVGWCPAVAVVEARPDHYARRAEAIVAALEDIVPGVEAGPTTAPGPGWDLTAVVDLGGLVACWAGPDDLYAALLESAPAALGPRLGVAPTKFAALVAAVRARPGHVHEVGDDDLRAFLSDQPVAALPVSAEMRRRLALFAIPTLGALAALPRPALVAQFGPEGGRAWDLARGAAEPVRPRPVEEPVVERLSFADADPLVSREAVVVAVEHALNRALGGPACGGRAARQVVVTLATERGGRWERVVTVKEATAHRPRLWAAVHPPLAEADLPGPVVEVAVELRGLTAGRGFQGELVPARGTRHDRLQEGLRQLQARYGHCPVGRVVAVEPWSRVPERRWALIDCEP